MKKSTGFSSGFATWIGFFVGLIIGFLIVSQVAAVEEWEAVPKTIIVIVLSVVGWLLGSRFKIKL